MTKDAPISRMTVDLQAYPDLVAIYLGMKVLRPGGVGALLKTGREIGMAVAAKPEGLLLHEPLIASLFPLHLVMRQYWRDLDSLERWTREGIHRGWWVSFLKNPRGVGFWHETYRLKGGFEAIYDNMDAPYGLSAFAQTVPAKGPMMSARGRLDPGAASPPIPQ